MNKNSSKLSRLVDPSTIAFEELLYHSVSYVPIGSRPASIYIVLDSFEFSLPDEMKPPRSRDFDGTLRGIVLVQDDSFCVPNTEVLIALHPIPGQHSYHGTNIHPTVIFWEDSFWIPAIKTIPDRTKVSHEIYGPLDDGYIMEVIHKVDALEVPELDNVFQKVQLPSPTPPEDTVINH